MAIPILPGFVTLSSRGPGHRPFTAVTRVRIPLGSLRADDASEATRLQCHLKIGVAKGVSDCLGLFAVRTRSARDEQTCYANGLKQSIEVAPEPSPIGVRPFRFTPA